MARCGCKSNPTMVWYSAPCSRPGSSGVRGSACCCSRPGLQDEIERRLRGAPKFPEAAAADHDLTQPRLAGLRAERRSFARQRDRYANLRRRTVHDASDGIQIVLHQIVRKGFNDHRGAVGLERLTRM